MMCTVHMEGGWEREGVNICRAEVYCPHGWRVGQREVSIHRDDVYCPHGGRVGQRGVSIHRDDVYCPHGGRVGQRRGQHLQS